VQMILLLNEQQYQQVVAGLDIFTLIMKMVLYLDNRFQILAAVVCPQPIAWVQFLVTTDGLLLVVQVVLINLFLLMVALHEVLMVSSQ